MVEGADLVEEAGDVGFEGGLVAEIACVAGDAGGGGGVGFLEPVDGGLDFVWVG